jgi:hypothetical protein
MFMACIRPEAQQEWVYYSYRDMKVPAIAASAIKAVRGADWVVFCQEDMAGLPSHVQYWVQRWLEKKPNLDARLALLTLNEGTVQSDGAQTQLNNAARRTGMEFVIIDDYLKLLRCGRPILKEVLSAGKYSV